ncbi:MAG TPA: hypothetical protein VJG29_01330 [Candidatus Paceibacterota bacterium]
MQTLDPKQFPAAFAVLVIVLITAGVMLSSKNSDEKDTSQTPTLALHPSVLEAKAAILYDPLSGEILFEKEKEAQLPLASLTKLITAYRALESGEKGNVTITLRDLKEEGDSGLRVGESWSLPSLLSFALVTSSNDAIAAVARATHVDPRTNQGKVSIEELDQTFALNPTGLDFSSSTAGAYGSAYDVARLLALLLQKYPEVLSSTVISKSTFVSLDGKKHSATLTGRFITDVPGLIAMKTGFTDLAGGNLVVAFDKGVGRPLIAVVLGSSVEGRFEDIRILIEEVRKSDL